jgi:DNA-3-methyladenine glycosylase I
MIRCAWVPLDDPLYVAYHDEEWGVPERDDRRLFELLNLEGAQAGLSWATILRKREGYRAAFAGWDIEAIARFGERDVERLLGDAGIVRHRGKIEAAIGNARAALALDVPLGELLWSFVGSAAASASPARPPATPSCRRPGSWTTTPRTASGGRAKRRADLFDRRRLGFVTASSRLADLLGELQHERLVGLCLLGSLRLEHGDRRPQRVERLGLDLLRRGRHAEARPALTSELADQLRSRPSGRRRGASRASLPP